MAKIGQNIPLYREVNKRICWRMETDWLTDWQVEMETGCFLEWLEKWRLTDWLWDGSIQVSSLKFSSQQSDDRYCNFSQPHSLSGSTSGLGRGTLIGLHTSWTLSLMGICKFWPEMSYGIISCLFGWNTLWFELNTVLKCNLRQDDRVFTSEDSSHSDCLYGLDQGYFHGISLLLRQGVNF